MGPSQLAQMAGKPVVPWTVFRVRDQSRLSQARFFYELLMFLGIPEKCNKNERELSDAGASLWSYCCVVISLIMYGSHRALRFKGVEIEYEVFHSCFHSNSSH